MSLWFTGAATLDGLSKDYGLSAGELGLLTTLVQGGFVAGGLFFAVTGLVDRANPRLIFAVSAIVAALCNAAFLAVHPTSLAAFTLKGLTGFMLAGVYPVGMAMAASYSLKRRGLLIGLLVGALTLGSALPHGVLALGPVFGVPDWRSVIHVTSFAALIAAGLMLCVRLGPHHIKAARFRADALRVAFTTPKVRAAYLGYFGHMWELYAFWAWIGTVLALVLSKVWVPALTFAVIAAGAVSCVLGGWFADRIGKARVARIALIGSFLSGGLTVFALSLHTPVLLAAAALLWGITIIPDSPQFSALVVDHAPEGQAGSLLVLQTALGFALTMVSVQGLPVVAALAGWPIALALLVAGPIFGRIALRPLLKG